MIQMDCRAMLPPGITKSRIPETVSSGADRSNQGRALPSDVRVRSTI